ncbi:GatB/YqeY domain-containing protein [Methylophilaceae bacterium]|nr:GatB/YqeY domain-containing protein [Methylophilaceae bacterium]
MPLKIQINDDMKSAMRSKDSARLGAIRLLLAAIKQKEVDERLELVDSDIISIIDKMLKQRRDSIEAFRNAERKDLVEKEEFELTVLQDYMPQQLTEQEVEKEIIDVIKSTGANSMKDMGAIMNILKPKLAGKTNMADVSKKIKTKLI